MTDKVINVSFIIPAYNEEAYISDTIGGILAGTREAFFHSEIIVVDNGSSDKTALVASALGIRVLSIEKSVVSCARNYGVKNCSGDVLVFVDGDTVLTDEWFDEFSKLLDRIDTTELMLTGAPVIVPENASWIEKGWFANLSKRYFGGANMICTKALFVQINGFDETLETGEDYDFCLKAIASKADFSVNHNFEAIHLGFPKNLKQFTKREIWHGKGDYSSFQRFFSSSVSLISMLYLFLTALALISVLFSNVLLTLQVIVFLLGINLVISFKRFGVLSPKIFFFNYLLNFAYFYARALSLKEVIKDRSLK